MISENPTTSFYLVHCESTFVDIMEVLVNYAAPLNPEWRVKIVSPCRNEIFNHILSFEYIQPRNHPSYVRYIRVAKLVIDDSSLLLQLEKLSREGRTGESLGMSHIDCSIMYSSKPIGVELMVGLASYFIKNPSQSILFHSSSIILS